MTKLLSALFLVLCGCGGTYQVTNHSTGQVTYWLCSFREAALCREAGVMDPWCVMELCSPL